MAIYAFQIEARIRSDTTTSGNMWAGTTVQMKVNGGSPVALIGRLYREDGPVPGNRHLKAGAWDISSGYTIDQWYTFKLEVEESGSDLIYRAYCDGTLRDEDTVSASLSSIDIILAVGVIHYDYGGTTNYDFEMDNAVFSIDGVTQWSDEFADGDLTDWPITGGGSGGYFTTAESGGVYWGSEDYAGGSSDIGTTRTRGLEISIGHLVHIFTGYKAGDLMRVWEA